MKNYFIPNQNNDYHPHIFKKREVVKIIAGVLLLEAIFLVQVFLVVPNADFFASVLPGVLVNLANGDRQSSSLSPFATSPVLERAAQLKTNDMLVRGYFSHVTPDGKTPWYWLDLVGYKYSAAGENLAINFADSQDINSAWMNSPSHRANILNNKFTEIGVAAAKGVYQGRETVFVVQFFGKPARNVVSASPQPTSASAKPITTIPAQPTSQLAKPAVSDATNQSALVKSETTENPSIETGAVDQPAEVPRSSFVFSLKTVLTSPRVIVNLIFIILGGIIFLALVLKLLSRTGIQYAAPVFNGLLILVILISLFYFNHYLLLARAQIF